jgi:hypothetical protein
LIFSARELKAEATVQILHHIARDEFEFHFIMIDPGNIEQLVYQVKQPVCIALHHAQLAFLFFGSSFVRQQFFDWTLNK